MGLGKIWIWVCHATLLFGLRKYKKLTLLIVSQINGYLTKGVFFTICKISKGYLLSFKLEGE